MKLGTTPGNSRRNSRTSVVPLKFSCRLVTSSVLSEGLPISSKEFECLDSFVDFANFKISNISSFEKLPSNFEYALRGEGLVSEASSLISRNFCLIFHDKGLERIEIKNAIF